MSSSRGSGSRGAHSYSISRNEASSNSGWAVEPASGSIPSMLPMCGCNLLMKMYIANTYENQGCRFWKCRNWYIKVSFRQATIKFNVNMLYSICVILPGWLFYRKSINVTWCFGMMILFLVSHPWSKSIMSLKCCQVENELLTKVAWNVTILRKWWALWRRGKLQIGRWSMWTRRKSLNGWHWCCLCLGFFSISISINDGLGLYQSCWWN